MNRLRVLLLQGTRLAAAVALAVFAPGPFAQEVTLPLERYDELRALAEPEPEPEPEPPEPLAFEEAALTLAVGESSVRITQDLTLVLYGDGWQTAALGETGTFVDADFGTAEGRLGDGAIEVRGAGRHRLRLTSVAPVAADETATRPTWSLRLRLPNAALVHGVVKTGLGVETVEAEGAILSPGDGGRWILVAAPGAEVKLALRGAAIAPERESLPLRFEATSAVAFEVARHRRRARASIEARVRQGRLDQLALPVPAGFEVIDVGGDAIAGWDVEDGRLVVTPLAAVTGSLRLEVELGAGAAEEIASPALVPEGAAATLAAVKVGLSGDGLLELTDAGAGQPADDRQLAELPAAFRSAPGRALVLAAVGSPPRWQVSWADRTEVLAAQIDRLLVDVLAGDDDRAFYQLWAEVRSRGAAQLTLGLPAGAELIDARRDGGQLRPGRSAAGWAVPLTSAEAGQVIYLAGVVALPLPAVGEFNLPLPRLSAPAARVEVRLSLPGNRRYVLADANRRGHVGRPPPAKASGEPTPLARMLGAAPIPPSAVGAEVFLRPPGFVVVEAAWSALSATPGSLRLRITEDRDRKEWF